MSNEDRLKKVAEEQALHIAALKEKLDKIDELSSKTLDACLYFIRGSSIR
jgi:hypothetical protein